MLVPANESGVTLECTDCGETFEEPPGECPNCGPTEIREIEGFDMRPDTWPRITERTDIHSTRRLRGAAQKTLNIFLGNDYDRETNFCIVLARVSLSPR